MRTGLVMFLTCCSPRSSKAMSRRSRTCSCAAALRQIPPGSASASSRAAMLTPSPKMSPSSIMMSPTLMPMRNSMRCWRYGGVAGDHLPLHLDRTAHRVDDAGELGKEAVAGGFDDATPMLGDFGVAEFTANRTQCRERALFVLAHQPRIAGDIHRQNGRQSSLDPRFAHPGNPALRDPRG